MPVDDRELSEVLVQRDEYPRLLVRAVEDFLIAWIRWPISGPDHFVSGIRQRLADAAPDARVEEDFQAALPPRAGSTRSCPTSRRA
jgi:hypothetical protein